MKEIKIERESIAELERHVIEGVYAIPSKSSKEEDQRTSELIQNMKKQHKKSVGN